MAKHVGASVYNSANISVANNTDQALTFDSEHFDHDGIHSTVSNTSRLTCQTAGIYFITGTFEIEALNTTGIRRLSILLNGTTYIGRDKDKSPSASQSSVLQAFRYYDLAVNDYVELMAFQNSGSPLNVFRQSDYSPIFEMLRVG